jgi:hypothetical protein
LKIACPSSDAVPGAILLGVVTPGPEVVFLESRVRIDEQFLHRARLGRPPEQRFRFSVPCASSACKQWNGRACSLIDRILETASPSEQPTACVIRDDCRWRLQRGQEACSVCTSVVTDRGAGSDLPPRVAAARVDQAT